MAIKPEVGDDSEASRHPEAKGSRSRALVSELTDAFRFFDLNGDGKLSVQEVATVVRSLSGDSVAEGDLEELIRGVDADGDGCLDLHEFIDLNTRGGAAADDGARKDEALVVAAAFQKFDGDGDGFISAEELQRALEGLRGEAYSLEECRGLIDTVDGNGDRMMSLREFQALMNHR